MRLALLAPAALAAALVVLPVRAQAPGQTIDVGGWKVHLDKNADGSQTCVSIFQFDDKSMVGFGADTNKLTYLIISEPEAKLTKGEQIQVKYRVDSEKASKTATGFATSTVMVVVPISNPDVDFKSFASSKTLTVDFAGDTYDEPLDGSGPAIGALAKCIAGAK